MIIDKPELIFAKVKVLQIMIESTMNQVLSNTKDAEVWFETLNRLDNNGITTAILNIKMMIRLKEDKEEICKQIIDTLKRIEIIQDSKERNDWYTQIEELKEYFRDLNNEIITIEVPQNQIPTPRNILEPLLGHQDKIESVQVIREEQDARDLHKEENKDPKVIQAQRANQKGKEIREKRSKPVKKTQKKKGKVEERKVEEKLIIMTHPQMK
jgi:hypothetical protein